jgi:hypothetical protein
MDTTVRTFIGAVGNATANAAVPSGVSTASPYVPYSTTFDTSQNTQLCRIYHLGVASTDITHCSHGSISGGGLCGANVVNNLCTFIQAACTFGNNATFQFADMNACTTALAISTTITMGAPGDYVTANNTLACRYYHAGVAASYLATGAMGSGAGALEQNHYHCGHVLGVATTGGCGAAAAPVTKPPTAAPPASGSAAALPIMACGLVVAASLFVL